jgi:hypothetical protein
VKKIFNRYLKNNLGLINLFGKTFGRIIFLLLTSFFAYKLSIKDFAGFAIFWSMLRMFTFYSANNLYIVYFNKVRAGLIEHNKWMAAISANIIYTAFFFGLIFFVISLLIFNDITLSVLLFPSTLLFVIIRNLSEFSKSDNKLFLSIFIEDVLFYFLFFLFGVIGVLNYNSLNTIVLALLITLIFSAATCLFMFKRKFSLKINTYRISFKDFSFQDFKLGINYAFLRGNEVLPNFAVRYIGLIYFGDIFVAYAHIMYQFYNVFTLLTMSVISGFQSKITVIELNFFNKEFIKTMYIKIVKTIAPFVLSVIFVIIIFNRHILFLLFPKFIEYSSLLVKVSLTGLLFMLIQPLVFIFVYNNKVSNIRLLNLSQYFVMISVYLFPLFYPNFNEQLWLLLAMTIFIIVQGLYSAINYTKVK